MVSGMDVVPRGEAFAELRAVGIYFEMLSTFGVRNTHLLDKSEIRTQQQRVNKVNIDM